MTQEIKDKLEQAVIKTSQENHYYKDHPNELGHYQDGMFVGAQTILENPGEWGLWKQYDVVKHVNEVAHEAAKVSRELAERELQSQLTKYREALGRLLPLAEDGYKLHKSNGCHQEFLQEDRDDLRFAKEALKEVNND